MKRRPAALLAARWGDLIPRHVARLGRLDVISAARFGCAALAAPVLFQRRR
jgi:hypothetical protein